MNSTVALSQVARRVITKIGGDGRPASRKSFSFGVSKLPTGTLMYFCLSTSASFTIKNTFCPKVVLEYSPIFGTRIEQRLLGLQFQKVKVFPLQQTEILKQGDLVSAVGYLLLEIKRLLFP